MYNIIVNVYRFIFAREFFYKLNKKLFLMSMNGIGILNFTNNKISGEHFFIKQLISRLSKKKNKYIVFDIGANKGEYSLLVNTYINNAEIYSFEPHPKTFQVLKNNIGCIKNINLFNIALSDKPGILQLYDYKNNDGSSHASLSDEIFFTVHKSSTISHQVEVSTIDAIANDQRLDEIDLLKVDVEGYELWVLKGANALLKQRRINVIQFEFTQLNTTTRVFFKDFYELLSADYEIFRLLPKGLLKIDYYDPTMHEIFGYQNYIAILK